MIDGVTKTEIFLLVAHCPDAFNSQDWLRLPRGKRKPLWVSGTPAAALPGALVESWIGWAADFITAA